MNQYRLLSLINHIFQLISFFVLSSCVGHNSFHNEIFTLDSHNDTPLNILEDSLNPGIRHDFKTSGSRVDFPRMKEGGLDAAFFAVFVGQQKRDSLSSLNATKKGLDIIWSIVHAVNKNITQAAFAFTPKEVLQLESEGKIGVFLGIENGYVLGKYIENVKMFQDLGVRYITLCHTRNNDICDSSNDTIEFNGLSLLGENWVDEMGRLGIMIDISHASDSTFFDVLNRVHVPVIASHSNARAICNNPRNMSDEMLKALSENGGVCQVCVLSEYVKEMPRSAERDSAFADLYRRYDNFINIPDTLRKAGYKEWGRIDRQFPGNLATFSDLVDHIDHIRNVAGIDHVGIGTDFDGGGGLLDLEDVSKMYLITNELFRRGYSQKEIKKIWGGNFIRVMSIVQKKAAEKY